MVALGVAAGTSLGLGLLAAPDEVEPVSARAPAPLTPRPNAPAMPPHGVQASAPLRTPTPRPAFVPPAPILVSKHIRVDVSRRRVAVYEAGKLVRVLHRASFGRSGHETPLLRNATLSLSRRERLHRSTRYYGAPMPYALFLREAPNIAFHGGDTGARSHGCIHLARSDAKWLFAWVGSDPVRVDIVASAI